MMKRFALLAAAAALAGCGDLIPARLHLLPPAPAAEPSDALAGELVALNRMTLPEYAENPRMALVGVEGAVILAPDDLWADPLERSGTITLARALEQRTGAPVMVEPFPLEAAPTIRVEIVVDRFITDPGGATSLTGTYLVSDLRLNGLAIHRRFEVEVEASVEGYGGVAAAHSTALGLLADDLAEALIERWAGRSLTESG